MTQKQEDMGVPFGPGSREPDQQAVPALRASIPDAEERRPVHLVPAYLYRYEDEDGLFLSVNGHFINVDHLSDTEQSMLLRDPLLNPSAS